MFPTPFKFKTGVIEKSDERSESLRKAGNNHFSENFWERALLMYNKSIAYAETKEVLSLAYANRSAAFLKLEHFKECLENIQLARENDYPEKSLPKLAERENECKKLMSGKTEENHKDFFKLSYPANKMVPWVVDCVNVRWTQKYNRGIYATKDMKAGDIISIEEPVIFIPKEDGNYKHCFNCFKSNFMSLIPCDKTASWMFCSDDCKEQLYAKTIDIETIICEDMRVMCVMFALFDGKEKMESFIKSADESDLKKTIFDYDFNDQNDPKYKEKLAKSCLSLFARNDGSIMGHPASRAHLSEKAFLRLFEIFIFNAKPCGYIRDGGYFIDGDCIPLFASLINHSCDRNAVINMIDNKLMTYLIKPVKKGQQIFINYSKEMEFSKEADKKAMLSLHSFQCDCNLCLNHIKPSIPAVDSTPLLHMYEKDYEKVKECLKEAFENINDPDLEESMPSFMFVCRLLVTQIASLCTF